MAQDHYSTLGVGRNATPDEIKRAYRRLASQHHPDKGGDTQRFQEIQTAYDTLSDTQRRQQYDNPQPQGFHFNFGQGGPDINSIFGHMFGQGFGPNPFGQRQAPNYVRMTLWITLTDAAQGGRRPVALGTPRGQSTVEIEIPLGIGDGDNVQYQGLAPGGQDLVIQFRIHPDPMWQRDGLNLTTEVAVDIWAMILGGDVTVRGITGSELVTHLPARTQPRTTLRLRRQGLRDRAGNQGDLMVRVMPRIPENIAPEIIEAIQKHRD